MGVGLAVALVLATSLVLVPSISYLSQSLKDVARGKHTWPTVFQTKGPAEELESFAKRGPIIEDCQSLVRRCNSVICFLCALARDR